MLDESYVGKWMHVQSYKHDSSLHRTWDNAMIIECTERYIVIASTSTKVIEGDGRRWFTREPAVSIFFYNEWFNVIAMLKDEDVMYYCNIASPSLIDHDIIKYIDYDLDLKLLPDGQILQLDSKEYEYHRKKYAYPDRLDYVIKHVNERVKVMMSNGEFPFQKQKIYDYYDYFLELKEKQEKNVLEHENAKK